jgi:hypothetical protein
MIAGRPSTSTPKVDGTSTVRGTVRGAFSEKAGSMGPKIVTGRVIGSDGHPVEGASVMFASGPVGLPDIAQITDKKGSFALTAPAEGIYRVLVNAPDAPPVEHDVEVGEKPEIEIEVLVRR